MKLVFSITANPARRWFRFALPCFGAAFSPSDLPCFLIAVCLHFVAFGLALVGISSALYLLSGDSPWSPARPWPALRLIPPRSFFLPRSDLTVTSKPVTFSTFLPSFLFSPSLTAEDEASILQGSVHILPQQHAARFRELTVKCWVLELLLCSPTPPLSPQ